MVATELEVSSNVKRDARKSGQMSWVRLDDGLYEHSKVLALLDQGRGEALGLHLLALSWCGRNPTDGRIPRASLRRSLVMGTYERTIELADLLVEARLWETDVDGYKVHDWLDYNPSARERKKLQEARSRAGKEGGIRSAETRSKTEANREASASSKTKQTVNPLPAPSPPIPSRPDPTDQSARDPVDLETALAIPIAERAALVLRNPAHGNFLRPAEWPEVVAVVASWGAATGTLARRHGALPADRGLLCVLERLAEGHPVTDLVRAGTVATTDPYLTGRKSGLASFTAEVLSRLLSTKTPTTDPRPADKRKGDNPWQPSEGGSYDPARYANIIRGAP